MSCMTSVGFGNVASETDNEKIFTICMMVIACKFPSVKLPPLPHHPPTDGAVLERLNYDRKIDC